MNLLLPAARRVAWDNGYLNVAYAPPKPHEQRMTLLQPMRKATCEEVFCTWHAFGHEGEDEGAPFKHPQGVQCGDFARCLPCNAPNVVVTALGVKRKKPCGQCPPCKAGTANCPCADRGKNHRLPNVPEYEDRVLSPVTRANFRPQEIRHRRTVNQRGEVIAREVTGDEWKYRIQEGLDARTHILKRGI